MGIAQRAKSIGCKGCVVRTQEIESITSDYLPILWAYGGNIFNEVGQVVIDSYSTRRSSYK